MKSAVELLDQVLTVSLRNNASDIYLKLSRPPLMRIEGEIVPVDCRDFNEDDLMAVIEHIIPDHRRKEFFEGELDANFIYDLERVGRFRVNVFRQRNSYSLVMRRIETEILNFDTLGLPEVCGKMVMAKRGLILVTGPTGSGKSTSLASMIAVRKKAQSGHILTIEDPIEYIHEDENACIVNQREIGQDVDTFNQALESAVRQSPDVLLVGEMRDVESVRSAVYFAETGHLVLSTLHANNAFQTVERVLQFFPEDHQPAVLAQLALNLRAIVAQRLVPGVDGKRVLATEIMIGNARMSDLLRSGQLNVMKRELDQFIPDGMHSFDTSLIGLYKAGKISAETAVAFSDNMNDMRLKLKSLPLENSISGAGW